MMRFFGLALALCMAAGAADEIRERCALRQAPFGEAQGDAKRQFGRGRPYDIEHILLDLTVDLETETLAGTATHQLKLIGQASQQVIFDSAGLDVQKVLFNGTEALTFEATATQLKMQLPKPIPPDQSFTLAITYKVQRPAAGLYFRTVRMGYEPEEEQAWTQGEADDARFWFPCFDAPNERALTEVQCTVSADLMALSNGELVETSTTPEGMKRFHWRMNEPHVTYLMSLVVGHYAEVKEQGGGVPLFYYVRPEQTPMVPPTFGRTPQMMEVFQNLLQTPYPYSRYSQVTVVDFIAGGMENTTITTLMEQTLHDEAAHLTYSSDWLVAHELAHQWFGDLVTCRDWSQIWLNEGFASYFELLFSEQADGEAQFRRRLFESQDRVLRVDTGDARAPVVRRVYTAPEEMFDFRAYEKGACVLHMLRKKLGDALFFKGIKEYLDRHRNQSVETNDLLRTLEDVTGQGLEPFFHQWIYSSGYPEFQVAYEWFEEEKLAKVSVAQIQLVDAKTPLFQVETDLLFQLSDGPQREHVVIDEKDQVFHVKLKERPSFVRLDPEGDLIKKLEFPRSKEMMLSQLNGDTSLSGIYEACDALSTYEDDDVVAALASVLEGSGYWGVKVQAAQALGKIDNEKAFQALLQAAEQPEARVREKIAALLGGVRVPGAVTALEKLTADVSPYVAAAAITGLADRNAADSVQIVRGALERDSHNDVVRGAALQSLARLGKEESVDTLVAYTEHDSRAVRRDAMEALGRAGKWLEDKTAVRERLEAGLDATNPSTRQTAAEALVTLGDLRAVEALERVDRPTLSKGEREALQDKVKRLREQHSQTTEVKELRDKVEKLQEQGNKLEQTLKELRSRIEAQ